MNTDPRIELAAQRTILANERTFLAYVRTAIMILVSGITLIKLLGNEPLMLFTGLALLPVGIATGLNGFIRYLKLKKRLGTVKIPAK